MNENTITIDYNPYISRLKIFNNNNIENKTIFLDDYQDKRLGEEDYRQLLSFLLKRRNKTDIQFVGNEEDAKIITKIVKEEMNAVYIESKIAYSLKEFHDKIISILNEIDYDEKYLEKLKTGTLESIPNDLKKLKKAILENEEFITIDDRLDDLIRETEFLNNELEALDKNLNILTEVENEITAYKFDASFDGDKALQKYTEYQNKIQNLNIIKNLPVLCEQPQRNGDTDPKSILKQINHNINRLKILISGASHSEALLEESYKKLLGNVTMLKKYQEKTINERKDLYEKKEKEISDLQQKKHLKIKLLHLCTVGE